MKAIRTIAMAALALSVAACSPGVTATRNVPFQGEALTGAATTAVPRSYTIRDVTISVSDELSVSERNGYYPFADIVWRGDPIGDRHEQIGAIFLEAAARNEATLNGAVPVIVEMDLVRFHGVTERTRFSVGGNYNIIFQMVVRHAETGVILEAPRVIEGNLAAPGGTAAILADQQGQTEKVRVTDFLTQLLHSELTGQTAV